MNEKPNVAPYFNVWRPTDLNALESPAPIVVWNNGGCFRGDSTWTAMYEAWAAAGFVVLSLTEGGGAGTTTVADHGALIDWLEEQNAADGPYKGKLDLERVAAAGNSCGGITSLGLAAEDDRVKAIYILSGSSAATGPAANILNNIKIPVAYMVGADEDIAKANALGDYEGFPDGVPAVVYSRSSGDHVLISSDRTVIAQGAEIALNWFDLTLYGTKAALDVLTAKEPCSMCMPGQWTMTAKNLETLVR
jgi:hypothetical protein